MSEAKSPQPSDRIFQSISPTPSRAVAAPPTLGPKSRTDGIEPRHPGTESRPNPPPPADRSREAKLLPPSSSSVGRESTSLWLGRRPLDTTTTVESDDGYNNRGLLTRARGLRRDNVMPKENYGQHRDRVATALDRMGAGVVEVRDAFQRWMPWRRGVNATRDARNHSTAVPASSAKDGKHENTESFADDLEGAMVSAMVELRVPKHTAEVFCEGVVTGAGAAEGDTTVVSFADFVGRYADAAGLLREEGSASRPGGGVWAEGPGGVWVAVSWRELAGAKEAFDEAVDNQGDTFDDKGKYIVIV